MSPDDRTGTRELRFNYDKHHVIITAARDGTGDIKITDDFHQEAEDKAVAKAAVADAVRMLSIARHIAWEEFVKLGGTVEDLRSDD